MYTSLRGHFRQLNRRPESAFGTLGSQLGRSDHLGGLDGQTVICVQMGPFMGKSRAEHRRPVKIGTGAMAGSIRVRVTPPTHDQ
jgi:hypothetical protein